jgi:hypothetical protein
MAREKRERKETFDLAKLLEWAFLNDIQLHTRTSMLLGIDARVFEITMTDPNSARQILVAGRSIDETLRKISYRLADYFAKMKMIDPRKPK